MDFCYTYGAAVSPAFAAGGTRCGHRPLRRTQGAGSADLHVAARRIGYYGLPHQPAGWFAMTSLGSAVRIGGGTHGSRPTEKFAKQASGRRLCPARRWTPLFHKLSFRGAQRRGNPFSRASQMGITDCHTSDVGHWFAMTIFWGCGARRFAMTVFESTAGVVGASRTPPPTECGAGGRGRTPPLRGTWECGASGRLLSAFCKKIKNFSTMLLPFVQHRRRDLPIYRINFGKGELSL